MGGLPTSAASLWEGLHPDLKGQEIGFLLRENADASVSFLCQEAGKAGCPPGLLSPQAELHSGRLVLYLGTRNANTGRAMLCFWFANHGKQLGLVQRKRNRVKAIS